MNYFDAANLTALQARVAADQEHFVWAREQLIERLGECLCEGLGGRLTHAELKVLARARRNAALAQRELAQFLANATLTTLKRSAARSVS